MKRKLAGLGLILVLLMSTVSFVSADSAGFTTERFDVDVTITEDHVMQVKETIDVDFYESRHGIFRYVPYDGKTYKVKHETALDDPYESYTEDGNVVLQIGDPYETIRGKHTYNIMYDLVCYEDDDSVVDYLSLDLIPPEWQTSIESAEIVVHFPKAIDPAAITIFSGIYGTDGNQVDVKPIFSDDGKTMRISAENLERGEAITISAELPEGYWVDEASRSGLIIPLVAMLILIPALIAAMWFFFGRDPKLVKTVEFYAPKDLTPAEIGYVVDGTVDTKDLSAMIVYFAEKGYLEINEYEEDQFELIRKTEIASSEPRYARTLFDAYFSHGDKVKMDELPEDLADFYEVAEEQVKSGYKGENALYKPVSRVCRIISGILYLAVAVIPAFLATLINYSVDWRIAMGPVALTAGLGMFLLLFAYDNWNSMGRGTRKAALIGGIILAAANALINAGLIIILLERIFLAVLAVAALAVAVVFIVLMNARTKRATELLGKVLGFRDFIETAELEKLKMMVEENPSYFYRIMPYAFVFGLSDQWIKHFEQIPVPRPSWYSGHGHIDTWDIYWYSRMMNRCMTTMDEKISSIVDASSDSGGIGGFGGGGFSGGGFGGGGGGSW